MNNSEFVLLLELEKRFVKDAIELPATGNEDRYDLYSTTTSDKFILDVNRCGHIELSKYKLQTRYDKTKLPLVRIDFNGTPHRNPDGERISRFHIHIFREPENPTGDLPWAYDLEKVFDIDINKVNFMEMFDIFCMYCHIDSSSIQGVL